MSIHDIHEARSKKQTRPKSSKEEVKEWNQRRQQRIDVESRKLAYFLEKYPSHTEEPNSFVDVYKFTEEWVKVDELVNVFIKTYPHNVTAYVGDRFSLSSKFSQRLKDRVSRGELDFIKVEKGGGTYRLKTEFKETKARKKKSASSTNQDAQFASRNDLSRVETKVDKLADTVSKLVSQLGG